MKRSVIIFIISAFIGLGIGSLVFKVLLGDATQPEAVATNEVKNEEPEKVSETPKETATASAETEIFSQKGCLGCHSVSKLNLQGGATGPDLSQAFTNVEGKHGKPINEFLKEPTSAVMSGVIGGNPLTDDEINKITELLQQAAQTN